MYNEMVADQGMTTAMGMALLNIDPKKGIRSTALGPKMGMESTSLSRILKTLEHQGLISKESDPKDKRSVVLKLTPAGIEKRNTARDVVLKFNEAVSSRIGADATQQFLDVLNSVNDVVEEIRGENP